MDLPGLAAVITASGVFVTSVLQGIALYRQNKNAKTMLDSNTELHNSVNGQSRELKETIRDAAFHAGQKDEKDKGNESCNDL
jgi:hypothetical protein